MKIAWIVCANGLGHIKRSIKIINQITSCSCKTEITLFCEPWQIKHLKGWTEYDQFVSKDNSAVAAVTIPILWNPNPEYYTNQLLQWHKVMAEWQLSQFDHVVSDNLVEPLLYSKNVTLSGSFLWHDVLCRAFGESSVVKQYDKWLKNLLLSIKPDMVVSRYFAMPATEQQTKTHKVGIIHFNQRCHCKKRQNRPLNILIAVGNSQAVKERFKQIIAIAPILNAASCKIYCSVQCYNQLLEKFATVEKYNFNNGQAEHIDLAIIRAGLGTISDCIAAKIPMILLDDPNPEIRFNQKCLSQFGIGMSLKSFMHDGTALLEDEKQYEKVIDRFEVFEFGGEINTANFLLKKWGTGT